MAETNNATDLKTIEALEGWEELDYEQADSDLKELVKSPHFRRWFWHLLSQCRVWRDNFTGNSLAMKYQGMKYIGLYMIDQLDNVDPDAYITMIKEVRERHRVREAVQAKLEAKKKQGQ